MPIQAEQLDKYTGRGLTEDVPPYGTKEPKEYIESIGQVQPAPLRRLDEAGMKQIRGRGIFLAPLVVKAAIKLAPVVKTVAGKITGYTSHGLNQAIGRDGGKGVSPAAIVNAVREPVKVITRATNNTVRYVGNNASVVLNQAGRVVTTWARNLNGTRGR